jgi:CheY-like chemotaxis protein
MTAFAVARQIRHRQIIECVLIVDDDSDTRASLHEILEDEGALPWPRTLSHPDPAAVGFDDSLDDR